MANEIVKFESATGTPVKFTAEEVKRQLCPNISDQELAYVMGLCQAQKLNPFTKDVYIVKYKADSPASIITSKEVFSKRANANPNYEGFEAGVTVINGKGEIIHRQGSAVYSAAKEKLIGGWCKVFVKGRHPFYDEVTLEEYSTGQSSWKKMPATMIRKVAYVHCLREAFPDDFQGLYAAEEMGKAGSDVLVIEEKQNNALESVTEPNNDVLAVEFEEVSELDELVSTFAGMCGKEEQDVYTALAQSKTMNDAGWDGVAKMTYEQEYKAAAIVLQWIEKKQQAEELRNQIKEELAEEDYEF